MENIHFMFHFNLFILNKPEKKKKNRNSSLKSNENIHKKEDGSYYVVSAKLKPHQ